MNRILMLNRVCAGGIAPVTVSSDAFTPAAA